jgi:hypothetical protein
MIPLVVVLALERIYQGLVLLFLTIAIPAYVGYLFVSEYKPWAGRQKNSWDRAVEVWEHVEEMGVAWGN